MHGATVKISENSCNSVTDIFFYFIFIFLQVVLVINSSSFSINSFTRTYNECSTTFKPIMAQNTTQFSAWFTLNLAYVEYVNSKLLRNFGNLYRFTCCCIHEKGNLRILIRTSLNINVDKHFGPPLISQLRIQAVFAASLQFSGSHYAHTLLHFLGIAAVFRCHFLPSFSGSRSDSYFCMLCDLHYKQDSVWLCCTSLHCLLRAVLSRALSQTVPFPGSRGGRVTSP
jgi:hypothetical protein